MGQPVGGRVEYGAGGIDVLKVLVGTAVLATVAGGVAGYSAASIDRWGRPEADANEVRLLRAGYTDHALELKALRRQVQDGEVLRDRQALDHLVMLNRLAGRVRCMEEAARWKAGDPIPERMPAVREPLPPGGDVRPEDLIPPQKLPVLPH